ncbi:isocitrate lyase/PEP mutase family protein [Rhodovulum sp. DZ06]|uniref:isocitrate lyase/PEP mutase family protein n=1 Tax=Rhodovulum sp. DZ06 TaxID=3425126 RepID=UPI003D34FD26
MTSAPDALRALLAQPGILPMPCCFDPLSAKMIEQAGFPLTFMSGFAASAARLGMPDTGLMSYAEVVDQGRNICDAVRFPVIGDGDTGYGNPMNVARTVRGFAKAGFGAVMIEDQVSPKRCGHVAGKAVVGREEAELRIRAAADARAEEGSDILILARTDARHEHGLAEAIHRAQRFRELGADILFVEAPHSVEEMRTICAEVDGPNMANMVEGGATPVLPPAELGDIGYRIAAYPLTLLAASMKAMADTLEAMKTGLPAEDTLMPFADLKRRIGFEEYFEAERKYAVARE